MNWFRLLRFAGLFLFALGTLYIGLAIPDTIEALSSTNPIGATMSILFFGLLFPLLGLLAYLGYLFDFNKRRKTRRTVIKKCPVCKKSSIRENLFLKWFGLKEKAEYGCRDCNAEFEKRKGHYALSKVRKTLMQNKVCKKFAGKLRYAREWENIAEGFIDDVPCKMKGLDKERFIERLWHIKGNIKLTESRPGVVCLRQQHFWMIIHACYFYRTHECVMTARANWMTILPFIFLFSLFCGIPGIIPIAMYFYFKRKRRDDLKEKIMKLASEG